jgi:hypothetical protein
LCPNVTEFDTSVKIKYTKGQARTARTANECSPFSMNVNQAPNDAQSINNQPLNFVIDSRRGFEDVDSVGQCAEVGDEGDEGGEGGGGGGSGGRGRDGSTRRLVEEVQQGEIFHKHVQRIINFEKGHGNVEMSYFGLIRHSSQQ